MDDDNGWEQRLADAWASIDRWSETEFLALIAALAVELPPDSGVGLFERASSLDSTGHADRAVPRYPSGARARADRRAPAPCRRSAGQLAAEPGPAEASVALLRAELDAGSDGLDDAVRAFLALALVDTGHEREAVSLALAALAPHLPGYQRSLAGYAAELVDA